MATYLRGGPQVDDTVQLEVPAELAVQPAVPVLIDGPLRVVQAPVLVEVGGKDVPEGRHFACWKQIKKRSADSIGME